MKSISMSPVQTQTVFAIKAALLAERVGVAVAAKYLEARRVPLPDALRILAPYRDAK